MQRAERVVVEVVTDCGNSEASRAEQHRLEVGRRASHRRSRGTRRAPRSRARSTAPAVEAAIVSAVGAASRAATSTRSRAAASIASTIATYASAARAESRVGPAASSSCIVRSRSRTMELYASALCRRRERAARRLNPHRVQLPPYRIQPTRRDRPAPPRPPRACFPVQRGVDVGLRCVQLLQAGRARVQDREGSGGALVGERGCEITDDERLLGCASEIAERRRIPPVAHRAGDRDAEQHGDRQEHQQHQLCTDAQSSEQRRPPDGRGRGHGLAQRAGGG